MTEEGRPAVIIKKGPMIERAQSKGRGRWRYVWRPGYTVVVNGRELQPPMTLRAAQQLKRSIEKERA